jgi:hypothetical protein
MVGERITPGMLRIVAAGNRGRFGETSLAETLDNAAATMDAYEARIADLEAALRTIAEPGVIPGGPVAFARKALAQKGKGADE